jgi:hypothetical protein
MGATMVILTANLKGRIQRLHHRAEDVRTVAEGMHDPQYKRTMVLIAESYDQMANKLELLTRQWRPEEHSHGLSPESDTTIAEPK